MIPAMGCNLWSPSTKLPPARSWSTRSSSGRLREESREGTREEEHWESTSLLAWGGQISFLLFSSCITCTMCVAANWSWWLHLPHLLLTTPTANIFTPPPTPPTPHTSHNFYSTFYNCYFCLAIRAHKLLASILARVVGRINTPATGIQ